jgi:hypothetical protein
VIVASLGVQGSWHFCPGAYEQSLLAPPPGQCGSRPEPKGAGMNTWHVDLDLIVLLLVGLLTAYAAYKWKDLATPLTVGAVVVTLLVLLLQGQEGGGSEQRVPPASCSYETARCHGDGARDITTPTSTPGPVRE